MTLHYPYLAEEVKPHMDIRMRQHAKMQQETGSLREFVAQAVREAMASSPDIDTQEKLAKKAGIAQSHVSRLLRGQNVTIDVLEWWLASS